MKHIRDIEKAWIYLNQWIDVTSRLGSDGKVMIKEMERLSAKTKKLIREVE